MTQPHPGGYNPAAPLEGATACPHCGAVAHVRRDSTLRAACNVCGGPRVPSGGQSPEEKQSLELARTANRYRTLFKVGAWIGGAHAAMASAASLLTFFIVGASTTWLTVSLAAILPIVLLSLWASRKSKKHAAAMTERLDHAWQVGVRHILAQHPEGMTAETLARTLDVPLAEAESILATLSVSTDVHSHVSPDGQVIYSAGLRIGLEPHASPSAAAPMSLDAELEALAAEVEAEQAKQIQ